MLQLPLKFLISKFHLSSRTDGQLFPFLDALHFDSTHADFEFIKRSKLFD